MGKPENIHMTNTMQTKQVYLEIYMYIHTHVMQVKTMKTEDVNLKERKNCMRRYEARKRRRIYICYNFKSKGNNLKMHLIFTYICIYSYRHMNICIHSHICIYKCICQNITSHCCCPWLLCRPRW